MPNFFLGSCYYDEVISEAHKGSQMAVVLLPVAVHHIKIYVRKQGTDGGSLAITPSGLSPAAWSNLSGCTNKKSERNAVRIPFAYPITIFPISPPNISRSGHPPQLYPRRSCPIMLSPDRTLCLCTSSQNPHPLLSQGLRRFLHHHQQT
jgi:hypothetical protein